MIRKKEAEREKKKLQKKLMKKLEKKRIKEEKKRMELEEQLAKEAAAKLAELEAEEDTDENEYDDVKKVEREKVQEKKRIGFDENTDVRPYGIQNSSYASFKFLMKLLLGIVCLIVFLYFTKP